MAINTTGVMVIACLLSGCSLFLPKRNARIPLGEEGQKNRATWPANTGVSESDASLSALKKEQVVAGPTRKFQPDNFVDVTEQYGLKDLSATRLYAVDFNGDGETDIVYMEEHYSVPKFLQFDPALKKYKLLKNPPFPTSFRTSFLNFADFNHDGLLDVVAGTLNQESELSQHKLMFFIAQKEGGKVKYHEIPNALANNRALPNASAIIFDFDLDGVLDIFLGNWFFKSKGRQRAHTDILYKGIALPDLKTMKRKGSGPFFVDVSYLLEEENLFDRALNMNPNARATFGASTCDLDQNGYPDILTASSSGQSNKLWMNIPGDQANPRRYKDYARESGYGNDVEGSLDPLGGGNSFYSTCFDYNNDGIMDVALGEVFHSYDPETRDRSSILTGSALEFPPKFIRTEYIREYGPTQWSESDRRGVWLDYNNDTLPDLLVENTGFPPHSRLILFEQETNHAYSDVAENSGINILNPSGLVKLDFNHDGLMDLLVGQTNIRDSSISPRLFLFENINKREGRRSLRIYLQGQQSNLQGLGSMVYLKASGQLFRQYVEYAYGHLPDQNEEGIHFGLGELTPEYLEVRWPFVSSQDLEKHSPMIKRYDLSKFSFSTHTEVTLCENGRYRRGRWNCQGE